MVPLQTALALALATLINVKVRGSQIFRTIFYAPSVTSSVVITMILLRQDQEKDLAPGP